MGINLEQISRPGTAAYRFNIQKASVIVHIEIGGHGNVGHVTQLFVDVKVGRCDDQVGGMGGWARANVQQSITVAQFTVAIVVIVVLSLIPTRSPIIQTVALVVQEIAVILPEACGLHSLHHFGGGK